MPFLCWEIDSKNMPFEPKNCSSLCRLQARDLISQYSNVKSLYCHKNCEHIQALWITPINAMPKLCIDGNDIINQQKTRWLTECTKCSSKFESIEQLKVQRNTNRIQNAYYWYFGKKWFRTQKHIATLEQNTSDTLTSDINLPRSWMAININDKQAVLIFFYGVGRKSQPQAAKDGHMK